MLPRQQAKFSIRGPASGLRGAVSPWLLLILLAASGVVLGFYAWLLPERNHQPPLGGFAEVAAEMGIDFIHNNGATEEELLPETMGSGVAIFDLDGDGWQDLLFVNSTYWPWESQADRAGTTPTLYRNRGDGSFEDITRGSGLDVSLFGMGVAVGDYDNDGLPDVYLTTVGENRLFRNAGGGRFEDVTLAADVAGESNEWSASAAWVDLDNDGLLDLFVCNYVRWPKEQGIELAFKLAAIGRGYAPHVNFTGAYCDVYLNNGDGTFSDISEASGIEIIDEASGYPLGRSLAVAPIDFDDDGWIDLIVANHNTDNFVFRNLGGGRFEEIGSVFAATAAQGGRRGGAVGIDAARISDGAPPGVAVGSFANELGHLGAAPSEVLLLAEEALAGEASGDDSIQRFGLFFFDFDLDGRLDLLTANGYLEQQINRIESVADFRRPARLYWNGGDRAQGRFEPLGPGQAGGDLFQPIVGRGAAFGDLDGDGDLDVVLTQNGGRPLVLRNGGTPDNNWLRIHLQGSASNRDGIGAWVRADVGTRSVRGTVMPTRSYLSQSELPLTLGLGRATRVRRLTVYWPDGDVQVLKGLPVNRSVTIRQDAGLAPSPASR